MNAETPKIVAAKPVEAPKPTGLALLRQPFPEHQISKLPKPSKKQTDDLRAAMDKKDFSLGIKCTICGTWHHKDTVHLDYVGHAALTDRLLDCDPHWNWEPLAFAADGTPLRDAEGGLWIKLTVCGVTRLGYGNADGKRGGDAIKELIGDALRNAAMRFGAALDLWHKGQLHADEDEPEKPAQVPLSQQAAPKDRWPGDEAQRPPAAAPVQGRTLTKPEGETILAAIAACDTPEAVGAYMAGLRAGPMAFAADHPKIKAAADARIDALAPFPGETHPALAGDTIPY